MNPLIKLWQFSLWFLYASVSIACAPVSLVFTGVGMAAVAFARYRASRRHEQYSWTYQKPGKVRKSGYRRARRGIFS